MTAPSSGPLLHIGFHKTASSWLQRHLFTSATIGFYKPISRATIADTIVKPHTFDFTSESARRRLRQQLDEERAARAVLSHERLSGNPHSGGYDSAELGRRLSEVFPEARILIVVREQRSMILSTYFQYVKIGGTLPLERYLDPPDRGWGRVPMFDPDHFKYDRIVDHYVELFGPESILVLPFEYFTREPRSYAARIAGFCDLSPSDEALDDLPYQSSENPRQSVASLVLERYMNFLISHDRVTPSALYPSPTLKRWTRRGARFIDAASEVLGQTDRDEMRALLDRYARGRYEPSNRRLADSMTQTLSNFDYLMPTEEEPNPR